MTKTFHIENIGRLKLKKPMAVVAEFDEANREWMVGCEELDLWGFGETEANARCEFERELLIEATYQYQEKFRKLQEWLGKEIEESERAAKFDRNYWTTRRQTLEEVRRWLDEII